MAEFNYKKKYEDYLKDYYEKQRQLQQYQANNDPGKYQSQYYGRISGLMNTIDNRQPFSYDFTKDPKYQAMRDEYDRLGRRAMINTQAQAAQLTGGYGNSYGATASAAAYNQHMQQAASLIPQYEELAYNRYQQEGQDLYNRLAMYQNADQTDYGRYRDRVGDYQTMLNYYTNLADTAYNRGDDRYKTDYSNAYNLWRAQQQDEQDARDYAERVRQYNEQMAFDREKYEYQKQQDAANLAYNYAKMNSSGDGSDGSGNGSGSRGTKKSNGYLVLPEAKAKNIYNNLMDRARAGKLTKDMLSANIDNYIEAGYDPDDIMELLAAVFDMIDAKGNSLGNSGGSGRKVQQTK